MRKLLVTLLSLLVLGTGAALAQEDTDVDVSEEGVVVAIEAAEGVDFDTTQYVGAALGYPFTFHYGIEDLISEGADLRIRLSSLFYDLTLGADVLFDITQLESNIQLYGGGGLGFSTVFGAGLGVTLNGLVGGEYRFNRELGLFAEIGAGYTFGQFVTPLGNFYPRGALGVNYHF
jgi:hypothetical protein